MLAQPTVSKPSVAILLRTAVTPKSAPKRSHVLLAINDARVPSWLLLLLSTPWTE